MPPVWFLWTLLVVNVLNWLLFGIDKALSRRFGGRDDRVPGRRGSYQRIPENWLLLLTTLGGFVGAWTAVRLFRHKTRKTSFRWKLVAATVASVAWMGAAAWLSMQEG